MVVVVTLVGTGLLWVGPQLINLAFFDAQRDQPYYLIDFVRGQPQEVYTARYQQPLAGLLASESGELLAGYHLSHLVEGELADEWAYVNRLRMEHARDLVQVMTSSPYRLMREHTQGLENAQLGSYVEAQAQWRDVLVVWLVQSRAGAPEHPLASVQAELEQGNGRVVWDAPASALNGGMSWNHVFVVDFASAPQAFTWLRQIEVQTARALANARADRLALAVYLRG